MDISGQSNFFEVSCENGTYSDVALGLDWHGYLAQCGWQIEK
jgi:hypothetical protein